MKKFQIGQKVQAIDDNLEGIIRNVEGGLIDIETSDGFLVRFRESELILSPSQHHKMAMQEVPDSVVATKEHTKKRKVLSTKSKDRQLPPMEVDLHIYKITSDHRRMTNYEMLNLQVDTAKRQLEFAISKRIPRVVFIHGVGEGVLKEELHYLFKKYDSVKSYPADFQKYGQGATEVYILQNPKS